MVAWVKMTFGGNKQGTAVTYLTQKMLLSVVPGVNQLQTSRHREHQFSLLQWAQQILATSVKSPSFCMPATLGQQNTYATSNIRYFLGCFNLLTLIT